MTDVPAYTPPVWRHADGSPISCVDKIKVLNENMLELLQMAQDAFEDAILLECPEAAVRAELHKLVDALLNPYLDAASVPGDPC